jgi:hypothetical protein
MENSFIGLSNVVPSIDLSSVTVSYLVMFKQIIVVVLKRPLIRK